MGAMTEIKPVQIVALPPKNIWFTDEQAAGYLSFQKGYFQQKIIVLPNFPKPRIVGHGRRWNADELSKWIDAQTDEKVTGRPRKNA